MRYLFLLLLFACQHAWTQIQFVNEVIYTHTFKSTGTKEHLSFLPETPSSDSYSIHFNQKQALHRDGPLQVQSSSTIHTFTEDIAGGFIFVNVDSNYSLIKKLGCSELRKVAFGQLPKMDKVGDTIILSKKCQVYRYLVFGEPNYIFITEALPRCAGIVIAKNVDQCIIGYHRRDEWCIAERIIQTSDTFSLPSLPSNLKVVEGRQRMQGYASTLKENVAFPVFAATTLMDVKLPKKTLKIILCLWC